MRHFDLCIIGSGSGNTIIDDRFANQEIAMVEAGRFGGTCLNVGCIPSKMYVYPATLARTPEHARRLGVDLELVRTRWPDIRDRIFARVDRDSTQGRKYRMESDNVTVFDRRCHFVGTKQLAVGAETITADRFVVAAGSRPVIPEVSGLESVPYHTSDSVMRLAELPGRMVIMGGGYVAAEFAHVFSALGTVVTLVNRSDRLLRREDDEIAARFTEELGQSVDVHLETKLLELTPSDDGEIQVALDGPGGPSLMVTDSLLIAVGRVPNSDTLNLPAAGIETDDQGRIVVDEYQRTSADGTFALGDVCTEFPLKHVANEEARTVQHNLLNPDAMVATDHRFVPHAVFSEPQIAAVGLTEAAAKEQGIDCRVGRNDYGETAYGWAMEDTGHFVKVIADADTGLLVGAHLIGPQASSLIQPLVQAMSFSQRPIDVARGQYWIHPAMAEVVENALLDLD
ncbi:MAG TPA: mycothione reductase [Propionibacteriaceae bacterium]|nr:mycothione reductase [Propionibacteriaceae bacterium]